MKSTLPSPYQKSPRIKTEAGGGRGFFLVDLNSFVRNCRGVCFRSFGKRNLLPNELKYSVRTTSTSKNKTILRRL